MSFLDSVGYGECIPIEKAKELGWVNISDYPDAIVSAFDVFATSQRLLNVSGYAYINGGAYFGQNTSDWNSHYFPGYSLWRHQSSPSWREGELGKGPKRWISLNPHIVTPLPLP